MCPQNLSIGRPTIIPNIEAPTCSRHDVFGNTSSGDDDDEAGRLDVGGGPGGHAAETLEDEPQAGEQAIHRHLLEEERVQRDLGGGASLDPPHDKHNDQDEEESSGGQSEAHDKWIRLVGDQSRQPHGQPDKTARAEKQEADAQPEDLNLMCKALCLPPLVNVARGG